MNPFYINGNRCDIVDSIVLVDDRAIVLGKNDTGGCELESTTFEIPIDMAEKLANSVDSPIGGTTLYEIQ